MEGDVLPGIQRFCHGTKIIENRSKFLIDNNSGRLRANGGENGDKGYTDRGIQIIQNSSSRNCTMDYIIKRIQNCAEIS